MPKATVSRETHHFELKSVQGGFVDLVQLPYHQMLERRDMATRMVMDANVKADSKVGVEMMNRATAEFEFAHCIVDHNLEDEEGHKLDFQNPMTLQILDPRVGLEIEKFITDLNQEADTPTGFTNAASPSSTPEPTEPS